MGKIDIRFREPIYADVGASHDRLVFPTEANLLRGRSSTPYRFRADPSENPQNGFDVEDLTFLYVNENFPLSKVQRDLFKLINPVREALESVDLEPNVSGKATLGYSTMPVYRRRFFMSRQTGSVYPVAFRLVLGYKDDEIGKVGREGIVAIAPSNDLGYRLVVVSTGEVLADSGTQTAFDKIRIAVLDNARKFFNDAEERKSYGGLGTEYMFAFFEPNTVKAAAKTS